MYTLYYLPDACPLATHVVLNELGQDVNAIDKQKVSDFHNINPTGMVPVLVDGNKILREGAAIMLYLLDKHENTMLPASGPGREQAIQNIMFANASMHKAYNRLFFASENMADETIFDEKAKQATFDLAAKKISQLWQVVEDQLATQDFLGGDTPSAADIMLAVYSRWGAAFPVNIQWGPKVQAMLDSVLAMPSFQDALAVQQQQSAA